MSRARTWIALAAVGHLAACSSTFKQLSPTPSGGGEPSGKAGPFLNSPFFLAIETGVLVGGVSQLYNWAKARSDRQLAEDNARREKQIALLSEVAKDIPTYISTMGSMRQLRTWLEDHKDPNERDDLGRPHDDVLKEYTEFFKLYLKTRSSTSILAEVGSYYEDKHVCELVNEEERAIAKIHDSKDKEERKKALDAEEKVFDTLLGVMAEEIGRPRTKASSHGERSNWCLGQAVESPSKK
jgi:hypothetical protein